MDLRVYLKLDGSGFQQGLAQAKQAVGGFASNIGDSLKSRLASVFAAGAVAQIARTSVAFANQIAHVAAVTQLTTDKVQELAYAASQSDTDLQSVASAYSKLSRTIVAARNGNKEAIDALRLLGVNIENIRNMNADAVMQQIADGIGRIGDETENAAAFMTVMGKGANDLRPFLQELRENQSKFRENVTPISEKDLAILKEAGDRYAQSWINVKGSVSWVAAKLETIHADLADSWDAMAGGAKAIWTGLTDNSTNLREQWTKHLERWRYLMGNIRGPFDPQKQVFRIQEGDFGQSTMPGTKYSATGPAAFVAEQEKVAEINERIADLKMQQLDADSQRSAILAEIARLEKEIISERFQGNDVTEAELMLRAEQLRVRLANLDKVKPVGASPYSDSLLAVGNFLGNTRGKIESIGQETNRILRRHTTLLETIARNKTTPSETIQVP